MYKLKKCLGWFFIAASVFVGLYVGIWLMLVGGIIQVIHALQVSPVDAYGVAWGIVRIVLAAVTGVISFWASIGIGTLFLSSADNEKERKRRGFME